MYKQGDEIWILQSLSHYRRTIDDRISRCLYSGKDVYNKDVITFVSKEGKPGMSMAVTGDDLIFPTLEELKSHLIHEKTKERFELLNKIKRIDKDIEYTKSLKDTKEDREMKLNKILND